jgi:hypothetical protein
VDEFHAAVVQSMPRSSSSLVWLSAKKLVEKKMLAGGWNTSLAMPQHAKAKVLGACAIFAVLAFATPSLFSVSHRLPPACSSIPRTGQLGEAASAASAGRNRAPSANVSQIVDAFLSQAPRPKPHKISMCTIIRDEGPYLAEWLLYHLLLGKRGANTRPPAGVCRLVC